MLRFYFYGFFLRCSVHVAQISIALGTMLYLISRKKMLNREEKCGLALLLFWFNDFEKDSF